MKQYQFSDFNLPLALMPYDELEDRQPAAAFAENTDLVVIRFDEKTSVLYGRCLHRGALLSDGYVEGDNLADILKEKGFRKEISSTEKEFAS